MVPVIDGPSVAAVRAGLVAASAIDGDDPPHVQAFRSWALDEAAALPALAERAAEGLASPASRSAREIAVLGFAAAADRLPVTLVPAFTDGVRWLSSRKWNRPFRAPTLEADGVSMLGVAVGVHGTGLAGEAAPIAALAATGSAAPGLSAFNRSLMAAAAYRLDAPGRSDLSTMLPEARVALATLRVVPDAAECAGPAWRNAMLHLPGDGGPARAALTLRAFDVLCERNMPARLGRLEPEDVVRVLNGVGHSLRLWTWEGGPRTKRSPAVRWDVENEYHVQNLLWVVLAPLFPDLRAEEYAPPVGHKNPRMDLTIPSLRLVVEVKFVRTGKRFADIVEEIAADASLYGADPRWKSLVPFVWDDSRRTEEHPTMLEGLRRLEMVYDAVILPRPGKMERPARPSGAQTRPHRVAGPPDGLVKEG